MSNLRRWMDRGMTMALIACHDEIFRVISIISSGHSFFNDSVAFFSPHTQKTNKNDEFVYFVEYKFFPARELDQNTFWINFRIGQSICVLGKERRKRSEKEHRPLSGPYAFYSYLLSWTWRGGKSVRKKKMESFGYVKSNPPPHTHPTTFLFSRGRNKNKM